jgi:hypothetical protein
MTRLHWSQLPASLHAAIEHELGHTVVDSIDASGGFSPGFAGRVIAADGTRAFVKAIANPGWRFLYEREARLAPHLPDGPPFPHLRFTIDDGVWIALGFDVIDGREATIPWNERDLDRVLIAHRTMADRLDPSPTRIERAGEMWGAAFMRWRDVARDGELADRLPDGWTRHLVELTDLEAAWPELTVGDHLVHLDLRADNILLTEDDVFVVDWAFAARGQPWMDLVCLLSNVGGRRGPDPETVWRQHPWYGGTDQDAFDAFLAAWAGMLTHFALTTENPILSTLRAFHAEQASDARRWLAQRRGWDDGDR